MTAEQPPTPSRHPRPGADARRRALGRDAADAEAPTTEAAAPAIAAPARRESLRDSLARIPDLAPDDPLLAGGPAPVEPAPSPAPSSAPAVGAVATASAEAKAGAAEPTPASAPQAPVGFVAATAPPQQPIPEHMAATATVSDRTATGGRSDVPLTPIPEGATRRPKPPMWRRVAFSLSVIALVAAIPVLGYKGSQLVADSKDGDYAGTTLSPTDPGYEAQVDPTPTAVAIQYDDQHMPSGVTFLSLAGGDGGGSVIFVPLDTEVSEPSFGVDRLRTAYSVVADRPTVARERLASQVGRLLNVGVDEIIDLDNAGWEQLVTPVGPLQIDNPDQIDLGFGQVIPSGKTTLAPNQVGAYLAATIDGESDLNRMARHEAVWTAWLDQLASSGKAEAVPGESTAGISKFAKELANGPVTFDTLPVNTVPGLLPTFRIDKPAVNQLITDTVASPTPAVPGSRFTVRMLNGVAPAAIPADLVRQIVGRGGAVTVLGNGPQFDTDDTTIVYANPDDKDLATLVAKSMGATGKVRLDREAPDTVDLTIVLGKDVLGDASGSGAPGATTPETTAAGGN